MNASDYKHTLTIRRDVWFLRFYCWMWKADPSEANVCKLFWGYLFAWVNLLARFVWFLLWPVRRLLRNVDWNPPPLAPKSKKEDIPSRASVFFARPWPRRIAKGIGVFGLALVAAFFIWGVVLLVPLLPGAFSASGEFLITPGLFHIILGYLVLSISFVAAGQHFQWDKRLKLRKEKKRERGDMTFGDVFVYGAKAVKANTCPRIEVVGDEKARRP